MTRAVRVRIDLQALAHNLAVVRRTAPRSRVLAVVKANAYGHGAVRVARALDGVDALAVANVSEAVQLRDAGIRQPLLSLQGFRGPDDLAVASERDLWLAVHHPHQIDVLEAARIARPVRVWLKLDTGMHRLGLPPQGAGVALQRLQRCAAVDAVPVLMTHLACADDPGDPATGEQLLAFDRAVAGLHREHSIANSAALLAFPASRRDWVRPGIMLYGGSPFSVAPLVAPDLRPVMTLTAPVIAVRRCRRGEAVGYGGTWVCPQDMDMGVVAAGYADGYPRHAPSGTPVLVNGRRARLAGRVSMDMITIDLRELRGVRVGDEATLWGHALPVDEVARHAGTIGYELLAAAGRCLE